jgi:hypothetical protein
MIQVEGVSYEPEFHVDRFLGGDYVAAHSEFRSREFLVRELLPELLKELTSYSTAKPAVPLSVL